MSQKAIREYDGKQILAKYLSSKNANLVVPLCVQIDSTTDFDKLPSIPGNEWLLTTPLVVKPDQLIKRRGKAGLVGLKLDWPGVTRWVQDRMNKVQTVGAITGELNTFIVEPFVAHEQTSEFYICIYTEREGDMILFHHEGGVDIGDVDAKASKLLVPALQDINRADVMKLTSQVADSSVQTQLVDFIVTLYDAFSTLHFAYLEVNPLVEVTIGNDTRFALLDLAAKLDETASFEVGKYWLNCEFPPAFGLTELTKEEEKVRELDSKTGASLKLTVLNAKGRIWLMTAGGGASVVMSDTVADYGYGHELANYGEYSGAPSTQHTYEYACAILSLMTKEKHPDGKLLLISGGIANFTDVAATFKGIIKALEDYQDKIHDFGIKIYVRRAGPNYIEGLKLMREALHRLNIEGYVYGPELHLTSLIPLALGMEVPSEGTMRYVPRVPTSLTQTNSLHERVNSVSTHDPRTASPSKTGATGTTNATSTSSSSAIAGSPMNINSADEQTVPTSTIPSSSTTPSQPVKYTEDSLFTPKTRAIVYGMQLGAVQNMLDFDYISGRTSPSVACIVYPFQGDHYVKVYWNDKEILIPCLQSFQKAMAKFPDVDTVVNFTSFRSVYDSTKEILANPKIKCISIIAEGVPERRARELLHMAKKQNVTLIGPATVGGCKPGCFRIGNAGGATDNLLAAKLYQSGSIAYVTRSGGLSNELNHILSRTTDGVYEGIALGGDRFPGTTFTDHLLRYEADPNIKMMVLLGEVGGVEEYKVCELIKTGKLTKPIVAWCIGTVASVFTHEVQFGHAGSCAHNEMETAVAKNAALQAAGAHVPRSFDELPVICNEVYSDLVTSGKLQPRPAIAPPCVPVDYAWARKLGLIRKNTSFISSISDERGSELSYAGVPISKVISDGMGIGGVVGLLWFKKALPQYFCDFLELTLMLTADHGPAVSGAHNTIVAARAGKDLVSSLCSGLLTIGPRFGGALDEAAKLFSDAVRRNITPEEFVKEMHQKKQLISGIGHKIKSLEDPDMRVEQIKQFARAHLVDEYGKPNAPLLEFALGVEKITTKKKSTLILNVDGAIACIFVDMMRHTKSFDEDEIEQYIDIGILNGLFVLGRTIGFVGHYVDQNRFRQPLYRHPHDDISYFDQ